MQVDLSGLPNYVMCNFATCSDEELPGICVFVFFVFKQKKAYEI